MFAQSPRAILAAIAALISIAAVIFLAWRVAFLVAPLPPERPAGLSDQAGAANTPIPKSDQTPALPSRAAALPENPQAAVPAQPPSFDIVRVEPTGDTVVAGRAAPGSVVTLLNSGRAAGTATADGNGQFVIIPPALKPGSHDLSLSQKGPEGQEKASAQSVAVSVPGMGGQKPVNEVVVALAEPGKVTRVLSDPKTAMAPAGNATPPAVSFRTVEAEQGGGFLASGQAVSGAKLRIYLNDAHVAELTADAAGQWSLRIARGMAAGHYAVRADHIDPATGNVIVRAEVPFLFAPQVVAAVTAKQPESAALPARPAAPQPLPDVPGVARPAAPDIGGAAVPSNVSPSVAKPAAPVTTAAPGSPAGSASSEVTGTVVSGSPATVTASRQTPPASGAGDPANVTIERIESASVVRGDSLWRISRKMLGQGIRYTHIYDANSAQIRDPRRIYPGQILVVPMNAAAEKSVQ